MLDIKFIKENPEIVKKAVLEKKVTNKIDIDDLLSKYNTYSQKLRDVESHRNLRNTLSKDIINTIGEQKDRLLEEAKRIKSEIQQMEAEIDKYKLEIDSLLLELPNVMSDEVPIGPDDSYNLEIRKNGVLPKFNYRVRDHVELGEMLDIIDIQTAGKVAGSRFNYLKNEGVLLEMAIINYVFSVLTDPIVIRNLAAKSNNPSDKVFIPVLPPLFVKSEVMKKMDRFYPIDERYYFEKDDLVLIGSAEHSLGPMHMDQTLDIKDLPIRYIGFSPAFRREAGSYGQDVRGILRVHQFDKLEMESFTAPESGLVEQNFIVSIQEYLVVGLGLPYNVTMIASGDMGKPDFRQIDINTWIPSQNVYRETHTSDYMTDYQSRRLNINFTDGKKRELVHMNDATALAIGRILIAILENYQEEDGTVNVPEVLWKYTGFKKISVKK